MWEYILVWSLGGVQDMYDSLRYLSIYYHYYVYLHLHLYISILIFVFVSNIKKNNDSFVRHPI